MTLAGTVRQSLGRLTRGLTRGRRHRGRLANIDVRIAVTGTRGKSSLVTWLHDAFTVRGYDTYAKVTGERPHSLYNGRRYPIERTGPTMLYETEREIGRFDPLDAVIVENQGIREYTTRLVNENYVDPTIVVLTNVRRDHLDTLGRDAFEIARALARAVPAGSHVITGERNAVLADVVERELARRDATLIRVVDGDDDLVLPGEELVLLLEAVLAVAGAPPLTDAERTAYRSRLDVQWTTLPEGRVYDAATVNDVESTELVRRALQSDLPEVFQPLVYLRADRPGRTATFVEYLNWLAEQGCIEQVSVVGAHRHVVERRLDVPVVAYDERTETPRAVLDSVLADGWPVILMGNGVPDFMRELSTLVEARAATALDAPPSVPVA